MFVAFVSRSWPGVLVVGIAIMTQGTHVLAQTGPSLGGYGGSMAAETTVSAGSLIPYAGTSSGMMPYRMGGGSSLSLPSRGNRSMGASRTEFRLAAMAAEMGQGPAGLMNQMSGGIYRGVQAPATAIMPSGMRRGGVDPPRFQYPFYQPAGRSDPGSSVSGMPGM